MNATLEIPPALEDHRKRGGSVEILILDVDGVLTDNTILLDGGEGEWKPFFVPDGVGIRLLQEVGVPVALLSGRVSAAVHRRADELGIRWHYSGVHEKGAAVRKILLETGTSREGAVYLGDDLIDLPAMGEVDLPVAVANAHPEVRRRAIAVTNRRGGEGAVREVCEWILQARGDWESILDRFRGNDHGVDSEGSPPPNRKETDVSGRKDKP